VTFYCEVLNKNWSRGSDYINCEELWSGNKTQAENPGTGRKPRHRPYLFGTQAVSSTDTYSMYLTLNSNIKNNPSNNNTRENK